MMTVVNSFIKAQILQWIGYIIRKEENDTLRGGFELKSQKMKLHGRPKKRYIVGVYLKYLIIF